MLVIEELEELELLLLDIELEELEDLEELLEELDDELLEEVFELYLLPVDDSSDELDSLLLVSDEIRLLLLEPPPKSKDISHPVIDSAINSKALKIILLFFIINILNSIVIKKRRSFQGVHLNINSINVKLYIG